MSLDRTSFKRIRATFPSTIGCSGSPIFIHKKWRTTTCLFLLLTFLRSHYTIESFQGIVNYTEKLTKYKFLWENTWKKVKYTPSAHLLCDTLINSWHIRVRVSITRRKSRTVPAISTMWEEGRTSISRHVLIIRTHHVTKTWKFVKIHKNCEKTKKKNMKIHYSSQKLTFDSYEDQDPVDADTEADSDMGASAACYTAPCVWVALPRPEVRQSCCPLDDDTDRSCSESHIRLTRDNASKTQKM